MFLKSGMWILFDMGFLRLIICSQSERLNREPESLSLPSSWLQATGYDVVEVNSEFLFLYFLSRL